ncbi:Cytosine/adenosine deaminase [Saccharopolyspora kobensis]|uniref:Cytosine/adenosine deaminase n=1 Tax=Saccharopolyspora kobensis TaxID=146035 RepID=A0A1H5T9U0_9PSEU|nr:chlorohydrolase family protein [Saccharopolyspora kobensis]SEF59514.1 Cytosine/adenosine deaminase [Saccharopolyspora kobensis]SFC48561.1 Cytosine/adenosine deaminase [Saccharopolyspora kobensis]
MRTRWRASHVLAHRAGHHALLRGGEVVWEDDVIVHVGHRYDGPVDTEVDLGDSLVLPGLIDLDALTDIDHLVLDSWATPERADGLQWSLDYFRNRRRDVFTPQERATVREYALVQLALHGITTYMPIASEIHSSWAEPFDELVAMAETSRRIGLRGYLGPAYRSGVNVALPGGGRDVAFDEEQGRAGLRDAIRFLDHAAELSDPLVTGVLLPCRIETLTEQLMRDTAEIARQRDAIVRLHSLQGLLERELVQRQHGATPLEVLDRTGLLGTRLLIPHGLVLDRHPQVHGEDRGDLATLAEAGVSIVHCPQTSLRYGAVLRSFGDYRRAGINLCLGTDSFPPDLIRGMDLGVHIAKVLDGRMDAAPAEHYVDAATLGGARALGRTDLGRLEPGAQADLVAFRIDDIRDGVLDDPVRTFLLSGTARQATHSVVAGRPVLVDSRIPGVDLDDLRERAQLLFERMREAYSERDVLRRPAAELFPPTYPDFDETRS